MGLQVTRKSSFLIGSRDTELIFMLHRSTIEKDRSCGDSDAGTAQKPTIENQIFIGPHVSMHPFRSRSWKKTLIVERHSNRTSASFHQETDSRITNSISDKAGV